mmetsp:Transcript_59888/g.129856  ORF Transcript_59888/g.129856 Transcript_59888/m.129856 type:complete len:325 (-) Transcript_59888:25-999(-)
MAPVASLRFGSRSLAVAPSRSRTIGSTKRTSLYFAASDAAPPRSSELDCRATLGVTGLVVAGTLSGLRRGRQHSRLPCFSSDPSTGTSPSPWGAGVVVVVAVTVFAAIASGISSHFAMLDIVDSNVHGWVRSYVSDGLRLDIASFSNVFDASSQVAAWVLAAVLAARGQFVAATAMPVGFNLTKAIAHWGKEFFHRVRPSDLLKDGSFPSSHTARFTFCITLLLCTLLPRLLAEDSSAKGSRRPSPPTASATRWFQSSLVAWLMMGSLRVAADAHWASDTIGGASLGVGVASTMEFLLQGLLLWMATRSDPAEGGSALTRERNK